MLRQRDESPYRKNMSLRPRNVLVVEADRAIGAKIISVSRLDGMKAFNSVRPTARGHLSLSIKNEINLFRHFMMMGKIRATTLEIHQEEISDGVGCVDTVACSRAWPDQKLVEHGLRLG
jgi:hypothetical protein